MSQRVILGVQLTNRLVEVPTVQALFTEYGCNIKTRLGLHEVNDSTCSTTGIILLEMYGDPGRTRELESKLAAIEGVYVQKMAFED